MNTDRMLLVVSSTMVAERDKMSDFILKLGFGKFMLLQSSDEAFHCQVLLGWVEGEAVYMGREAVLEEGPWNRVKIFTCTKAKERQELTRTITDWVDKHYPGKYWGIADAQISSDSEFHCLTVTIGIRD